MRSPAVLPPPQKFWRLGGFQLEARAKPQAAHPCRSRRSRDSRRRLTEHRPASCANRVTFVLKPAIKSSLGCTGGSSFASYADPRPFAPASSVPTLAGTSWPGRAVKNRSARRHSTEPTPSGACCASAQDGPRALARAGRRAQRPHHAAGTRRAEGRSHPCRAERVRASRRGVLQDAPPGIRRLSRHRRARCRVCLARRRVGQSSHALLVRRRW
jgi:hypothetical protein